MRLPVYVLGLVLAAMGGYFWRGIWNPVPPAITDTRKAWSTATTPVAGKTAIPGGVAGGEMAEGLAAVPGALALPPAELAKFLCQKWNCYREETSAVFSTSLAEMRSILSGMTSQGLTALMQKLDHPDKNSLDGNAASYIRQAAYEQWGRVDPRAALAWLSATPAPQAKGENSESNPDEKGIKGLFEIWMRSDLPAAREAMQQLRPDLKAIARTSFYEEYGRMDPIAAMAELTDPSDAGLADQVFSKWLTADRVAALAALPALKLPPERIEETYESAAAAMSETDPEKALHWLETVPEAANSVFNALAATDPQKAASAILPLCQTPDTAQEFSDSLASIASHWCNDAPPEEVISWAGKLPEGNGRTKVITNIADQWTDKDAVAASAWIATLPQGDERDAAAGELIADIRSDDPAAALQWAGNMQDPAKRLEWQAKTFAPWFSRDPTAAWQEFNSRSPAEQAEISKAMQSQ